MIAFMAEATAWSKASRQRVGSLRRMSLSFPHTFSMPEYAQQLLPDRRHVFPDGPWWLGARLACAS